MSIEAENVRALTSTPSSTTSGCLSGDEAEDTLPSNLAHEELQLALNKVISIYTGCYDYNNNGRMVEISL